ncbi:MAG: hypothetical protein QM727_02400 [Niabella sp.]
MKNFTQEGNTYTLKRQYGMFVPLCAAFLLLAVVGFTQMPESSFKWWMLGIALLMFFLFLKTSLIIDMDKNEIRIIAGLFGKPITVLIASLQGFTIHKVKYIGFITINVSLIANYINDKGKEKEVSLVQSFFSRPIQSILNDIDDILGDELKK